MFTKQKKIYQKYERPPNVFTIQSTSGAQQYNKDYSQINNKSATLPRNMHSKVAIKHGNRSQRNSPDQVQSSSLASSPHSPKHIDAMAKSKNSPSKSNQLKERVSNIQNSTAKETIRIVNQSQINQDPGIIDGYLENVNILGVFLYVLPFLFPIPFHSSSTEFGSIKNSITECAYRHDNNSIKISPIFSCIS